MSNAPEPPVTDRQLAYARNLLRGGASLSEAAKEVGHTAGALDLALWRNLGGRPARLREVVA